MQVLSQTTPKILAPRPLKPIQHVSFQKLNSSITKEQFLAKNALASSNCLNLYSSSSNSNCSSKISAFSEMIEDLSQIRRDSQNPQERDNTFQEQDVLKEYTMDKEMMALEAEIEEMLSFHQ